MTTPAQELTLDRFVFIPSSDTNMTEQDMAQQWLVDELVKSIQQDVLLNRENVPLHTHYPVEWTNGQPKVEVSEVKHPLMPMIYTRTEYFDTPDEISLELKFVYEEGVSSDSRSIQRWYSAHYHHTNVPIIACDSYGNLRVNFEQPREEPVFRIEVPGWRKDKTLYMLFKHDVFEDFMRNGGNLWADGAYVYGVGHHPKQLKHHRSRDASRSTQDPRKRYDPAYAAVKHRNKLTFS